MQHFNIILFILGGFFVIISTIKPRSSSKNVNISDLRSDSFKD